MLPRLLPLFHVQLLECGKDIEAAREGWEWNLLFHHRTISLWVEATKIWQFSSQRALCSHLLWKWIWGWQIFELKLIWSPFLLQSLKKEEWVDRSFLSLTFWTFSLIFFFLVSFPLTWQLFFFPYDVVNTVNQQVPQGQYVVSDTRCPALHDCDLEWR